jgi:GNAT superfamily N-acetyltransferase
MTAASDIVFIEELSAAQMTAAAESLGAVLLACVEAGASVNFILPFDLADAVSFWAEKICPGVAAGGRRLLVARSEGRIVGTVHVDLATPPNQRHRAEVSKLLVHPDSRRRGIARQLMLAIEALARAEGRSLLTLDTVTGGAAEPLYASLGYIRAGVIPGYALAPDGGTFDATSLMFKQLADPAGRPAAAPRPRSCRGS